MIHLRRDQMRDHAASARGIRRNAARRIRWAGASPSRRSASRSTLQPLLKDQELVTRSSTRVTYWEGAVDVGGSFGDVAMNGEGYVEMTGYERAFRSP